MIVVVHAHPYPKVSRIGAGLLAAIAELPGLSVRSLYERYPDFDIDAEAERSALAAAGLVVWMHPVYWYSVPGLLKHWFDQVFALGWAYGEGGTALAGKDALWVPTTGGSDHDYTAQGEAERRCAPFVPTVEQTARFCGMRWLEPFIVSGASVLADEDLAARALALRRRLAAWAPRGEGR